MKVVSLFAGCGGFDLGFEKAGFEIIWANEYDKTIKQTYTANHRKTILNTNDIRSISIDEIPDCDGIIGGPPCQSWSEGGRGKGIDDPRGKLFLDYIRIVKKKQPKFFIIENVRGILESKHSNALNYFLTLLSDAGYKIKYKLLNALDFRVPQERYRVFFVGIRKDMTNEFTFPNPTTSKIINLRQAIGDLFNKSKENSSIANLDIYDGPYDEKYMSRNRVRSWDQPSFTIQAQAKNAPIHPQAPIMTYVSPSKRIFAKGHEHLYRRLSVRECARIQTFPDSFIFHYKNVTDGYKMVGNAVPPRLAFELAQQMKQCFKEFFINGNTGKKCAELDLHDLAQTNLSKCILVGFVKNNNAQPFLTQNATLYYTGRSFPKSIDVNKLCYFIPYIKGKGIKDIYAIKGIRRGSKKELDKNASQNDIRLFFKLSYVSPLVDNYIPVRLNIWKTYKLASLDEILSLKKGESSIQTFLQEN